MDNLREIELAPRISARGAIAGTLVGLALAAMMMALGNAVGATAFTRAGASGGALRLGVAAWFIVSFAVGGFGGSWLAAGAARTLSRRDGALHGLVTWAAIALASMSLVGGVMRGVILGRPGSGAEMVAWGGFAALLVPLIAAVAGGVVGAARERRAAGLADERVVRRRRPIVTSPQHTGDPPMHSLPQH